VVFSGFSDSTGESILNSLEAIYLGDVYLSSSSQRKALNKTGYLRITCHGLFNS